MSKMTDRLRAGKTPLKERVPSVSAQKIMTHKHGDYLTIPPTDLNPDPDQPRKLFDDTKIEELTASIKKNGVLQPLLVRFIDEKFVIVAGERRYRAAILADAETVPCVVTTGNPEEISLIENIQRENLKPIELAEALRNMMNKHNYSQVQVAKIIGKSKNTVSEILSINKIPESLKEKVRRAEPKTEISRRTLVEIAKEPPNEAEKMIESVVKGQVTSPQIRKQRQAQVSVKRSGDEILIDKIMMLVKSLQKIDASKPIKPLLLKVLRSLHDELNRLLR